MSWLNLNQSLNSIKGQITNFASEVLNEGIVESGTEGISEAASKLQENERKIKEQDEEISALKKLNDDLITKLHSERKLQPDATTTDNEESSWFWEPSASDIDAPETYQNEIQKLQNEIKYLKSSIKENKEINKLREENHALKANLVELDTQHQMAMEKLLALKKGLQRNFEMLKQEYEELQTSNSQFAEQVLELKKNIDDKETVIKDLNAQRCDYDALHHKYMNLEKVHSLLEETTGKFQEENQELNEENFKLQEELAKLQHDMEQMQSADLTNVVPKDKYDELVLKLDEIQNNRLCTDDLQINIDDNAKTVIENLKRDILELNSKFQKKCENSIDVKLLESVYEKYVTFSVPSSAQNDEETILRKYESAFKLLNNFKKDIASLEHELSDKTLSINHLQTQIDDLTSENEFLTSDLTHFERELAEMKKNNDFLIEEIATLKNTSKLGPISETNEDSIVQLESELEVCNKQKTSFENEVKSIKSELVEVKNERELLKSDLNDLRTKYQLLLAELDSYKSKLNTLSDLENASEGELNEKVQSVVTECENMKLKNVEIVEELSRMKNEKISLLKNMEEINHELQAKKEQQNEISAKKITLEHKLSEMEKRLDDFMNDKVQIELEKIDTLEKLKSLCSENSQNATFDDCLSKISSQLKNLGEKELQIARVCEENDELKKLHNKLMVDNSELFEKLASASRCFEQKEQELLLKLNEIQSQHHGSNQTDNEQEIITLKHKITELEATEKEINLLRDDKNSLLGIKAQLEHNLTESTEKITHLQDSVKQLMNETQELSEQNDILNKALLNHNVTINELKSNIEHLNQELHTSSNETMNLNRLITDLKALSYEKEQTIINMQNKIDKLATQSQSDTTDHEEIANLRNVIKQLEEKIKESDEKDTTIERLNKTVEELSKHEDKLTEDTLEKIASLQVENEKYKSDLEQTNKEKHELINLVTLKHNESLQYHGEIQRLSQVIQDYEKQLQSLTAENENLKQLSDNCKNCEVLKHSVDEKDGKIMALHGDLELYERKLSDISNSTDLINSLSDRCESLDKTLSVQLDLVKNLTAENTLLKDQETSLRKELERLRQHLVELEESYTQELMLSERKASEFQQKLQNVEERAKQTSTLYTSNSIRANQEVETLRNQIRLLEKQRDDYQNKLSLAEDEHNRSKAALTNLQVVLEQFQLEKEREIESATEKIKRQLRDSESRMLDSKLEIQRLNSKIEESAAGLKAASRLGDQLEIKTVQIVELKERVHQLEATVKIWEEKYKNATSNQQDKVEKSLVKNLLINYMNTHSKPNDRVQVLKILSTVLDLNQTECEKIGLAKPQTSSGNNEGLVQEFVKFLEKESARPNLPNMMGITDINVLRTVTPISRKNSEVGPPIDFGHRRQTSSGSNNILFQHVEPHEEDVEGPANFQITSQTPDLIRPTAILNFDNTGVTQTRNNEGAILKNVLRDFDNH